MATIVTRAAKGSNLEWNEVDANFTNQYLYELNKYEHYK